MKHGIIAAAALALVVSSSGRADETQYGRLAYASHDLSYATGELVKTVKTAAPGSLLASDVETLYDSSEHFTEEVQLGPQDLDVDFDTIESVFNTLRGEINQSPVLQQNTAVRTAWFETEEANIRLRQAWTTSGFPTNPTTGYMQCTARNSLGQTFYGVGATQTDAQGVALEYCKASQSPNTCAPGTCAPYQQ